MTAFPIYGPEDLPVRSSLTRTTNAHVATDPAGAIRINGRISNLGSPDWCHLRTIAERGQGVDGRA
jgi:hypothetical protein